ncbi:hypothetical protein PFDG_00406 [Plasmodium falciparum Dd2]|uniref:Gcp-like domain-containing protein n=1 Tax=Plasmodium falciparum (isolate Dd2) TaxID=57267 RepID=A0A0L7LXL1_PLAF4|nr:hypothetical protein PFDG_00406 [Plasmodium falciparum Dd2]
MKNVSTHIAIYLFCYIFLIHYLCYTFKIDNIPIKNNKFSDILQRAVKNINKHLNKKNVNYDICKYRKIPKILLQTNNCKKKKKLNYIVGIENTCDDTCICVIDTDLNIIKNVIISHYKVVHSYEGVYPFFISSLNSLFLKHYVNKILDNIDPKHVICYGFSSCPGIAKNMEAAKNYIGEKKKQNENIKISAVNHIFAHILSPLFFNFYNDKHTYTNSAEYKNENIKADEEDDKIYLNISESIKNDKEHKNKIKNVLEVLNKNIITQEKLINLIEDDFFTYGSYVLNRIKKKKKTEENKLDDNKINNTEEKTVNEEKKDIHNETLNIIQTEYMKDGYLCILVSGGSTDVYKVQKDTKNAINVCKISTTMDITIGDVIDKVTRLLELPVGLGGGPFLEKEAQKYLTNLKSASSENLQNDPFQPFPNPFSTNNIIDFSFSGIYNHMSKIIKKLKSEKSFEKEKGRYAYYCQKNIFHHLLKQVNKIMYFSELHFNIKNVFIVGGVGCNNFLYQSLKDMAAKRDNEENQIKEYNRLRKRLRKKMKKINDEKLSVLKISKDSLKSAHDYNSSLSWKIYLKNLLKKRKSKDILSTFKLFNFDDFIKLKQQGSFLLDDTVFKKGTSPWSIYKTPLNLSRDNAAMIAFNTFLNLHNKTNLYDDTLDIDIKTTVKTKLENNFLLLSDIIIFDVMLQYYDNNKG